MSGKLPNIGIINYFSEEFLEHIRTEMPKNQWLQFTVQLSTDGKSVYAENPRMVTTEDFPEWEEGIAFKIGDVIKVGGFKDMKNGYYRYTENGFVYVGEEKP
jgi:hypothetical protein